MRVLSTIGEPTKDKIIRLSSNFGTFYENKEYNTEPLDMNLQYIQETQIFYSIIIYHMDQIHPKLF